MTIEQMILGRIGEGFRKHRNYRWFISLEWLDTPGKWALSNHKDFQVMEALRDVSGDRAVEHHSGDESERSLNIFRTATIQEIDSDTGSPPSLNCVDYNSDDIDDYSDECYDDDDIDFQVSVSLFGEAANIRNSINNLCDGFDWLESCHLLDLYQIDRETIAWISSMGNWMHESMKIIADGYKSLITDASMFEAGYETVKEGDSQAAMCGLEIDEFERYVGKLNALGREKLDSIKTALADVRVTKEDVASKVEIIAKQVNRIGETLGFGTAKTPFSTSCIEEIRR